MELKVIPIILAVLKIRWTFVFKFPNLHNINLSNCIWCGKSLLRIDVGALKLAIRDNCRVDEFIWFEFLLLFAIGEAEIELFEPLVGDGLILICLLYGVVIILYWFDVWLYISSIELYIPVFVILTSFSPTAEINCSQPCSVINCNISLTQK